MAEGIEHGTAEPETIQRELARVAWRDVTVVLAQEDEHLHLIVDVGQLRLRDETTMFKRVRRWPPDERSSSSRRWIGIGSAPCGQV